MRISWHALASHAGLYRLYIASFYLCFIPAYPFYWVGASRARIVKSATDKFEVGQIFVVDREAVAIEYGVVQTLSVLSTTR